MGLLDFSGVNKWYDAAGGDDGFNAQLFMDREYAGERTLFDINGKTERFSASIGPIGAKWYYQEVGLPGDDRSRDSVLGFGRGNRGSSTGPSLTHPSPKTATLNIFKPLPPIPGSNGDKMTVEGVTQVAFDDGQKSQNVAVVKGVPFDYMFTDVDETDMTTIHGEDEDSLLPAEMTDDEDDMVPEDVGPSTPPRVGHPRRHARAQGVNHVLEFTAIDMSAVQANPFLMAALPTAPTAQIANHFLALGASLAAPLIVDEEYENDKAQATDIFFNGPVEESPGPDHAPLLADAAGYGDIREGAEECPAYWRHVGAGLKTTKYEEADAVAPTTCNDVPEIIETAFAAAAPEPKIKRDNEIFGLANRAKARKGKQAAALTNIDGVQEAAVFIDLTGDENGSETSSVCKKRRACSSFATRSTFDAGNNVADDDLEYIYTKKVRVDSGKDIDEVFTALRPSNYSLITQAEDTDVAVVDAVSNPCILPRICGEAKGFHGQFQGMPTTEKAERAKKLNAPKVASYVGQASHLNNLILHKDMHVCPQFETTEYTITTAPSDSDIGRCISYANKKTEEAAVMKRSPADDFLRREAHHECTMARLEGVVVGNYRYFQGHMTVEEYHECKMCICWQLCECSKLCTRYADLVCPCANKIETNCH